MRLIDADAYIEKNECCGYLDEISVKKFNEITPTIDVVERKKGFWEWGEDEDYRCSCCHKYAYGCLGEVLSGHYKHCPYCGAAMEGEEDDED